MTGARQNIPETCIVPSDCRERFLPLDGDFAVPLNELGVRFSGVSELAPPYEIGRRKPDFHLMIVTSGGRGGFETPDASGELLPGDLWITPESVAQHYWASVDGWRMVFFHLDPNTTLADVPAGGSRIRSSATGGQLESAMNWYMNEAALDTETSRRLANHYAWIIRECLLRELELVRHPERHEARRDLEQLWAAVGESLHRDWSVAEMARIVHLSTAQFRRVVVRHHGRTPVEMLQKMRMAKAQQLLLRTTDSVAQIAERVGYETPFSFSRAFRRECGTSPRAFRQSKYPVGRRTSAADSATDG